MLSASSTFAEYEIPGTVPKIRVKTNNNEIVFLSVAAPFFQQILNQQVQSFIYQGSCVLFDATLSPTAGKCGRKACHPAIINAILAYIPTISTGIIVLKNGIEIYTIPQIISKTPPISVYIQFLTLAFFTRIYTKIPRTKPKTQ